VFHPIDAERLTVQTKRMYLTLGYLEEPHSGGIGLSATPAGKHFSFGHPALLLSQLPVGNFLSSRLVCPER
jgi:hypothetical protein